MTLQERIKMLELKGREFPIVTPEDAWKVFIEGTIWSDILNTISESIFNLRNDLEQMGAGYSHSDIIAAQCEIQAFRTLANIPNMLLEAKENEDGRGPDEQSGAEQTI
jgi:hypothetical protein